MGLKKRRTPADFRRVSELHCECRTWLSFVLRSVSFFLVSSSCAVLKTKMQACILTKEDLRKEAKNFLGDSWDHHVPCQQGDVTGTNLIHWFLAKY